MNGLKFWCLDLAEDVVLWVEMNLNELLRMRNWTIFLWGPDTGGDGCRWKEAWMSWGKDDGEEVEVGWSLAGEQMEPSMEGFIKLWRKETCSMLIGCCRSAWHSSWMMQVTLIKSLPVLFFLGFITHYLITFTSTVKQKM